MPDRMQDRARGPVARFAGSLAGQLAVLLAVGMAASSGVTLLALTALDRHGHEVFQQDRAIDSAIDMSGRLESDPAGTERLLAENRILGARKARPEWQMHADPALSALLAARIGTAAAPQVMPLGHRVCFGDIDLSLRAAGYSDEPLPDCWFVSFRDHTGVRRGFEVSLVPARAIPPHGIALLYIALIALASGLLGVAAARVATAPLRGMEKAARGFSLVADAAPLPVAGPSEVRAALATFNLAQARVREGLRERTQILASVAHDLQTPLTRLRLRLEQVGDEDLRARLVADLAAMMRLVRAGLDLARSSEAREPWSTIDIDSLLSSIAEDATDLGREVRFTGGCGAQARVKPDALARVLDNLVSNALKYAGTAELSCAIERAGLSIVVADRGPGLAEAQIEAAFEPFRRFGPEGACAPNGSGIGLTIARAQAATFGALLTLAPRPGGGLVANIAIPAANLAANLVGGVATPSRPRGARPDRA